MTGVSAEIVGELTAAQVVDWIAATTGGTRFTARQHLELARRMLCDIESAYVNVRERLTYEQILLMDRNARQLVSWQPS